MAIEWSDEARKEAREHPEEHPTELLMGLEAARGALLAIQTNNYNNPIWEPSIGFLAREIAKLEKEVTK